MKFTTSFQLLILSFVSYCIYSHSAKLCITKCPNGGNVYGNVAQQMILDSHNKYRKMLLIGNLPGQPRAKEMKMLTYDKQLEILARNVTHTCKMSHVIVKDDRWSHVGQNLYIERSSKKVKGQNWNQVVSKWFAENKLYRYPNGPMKETGHYTQLVAQNTTAVGCDFIFFYEVSQPKNPYSKLYVCNYGPSGNIKGRPPYEILKLNT